MKDSYNDFRTRGLEWAGNEAQKVELERLAEWWGSINPIDRESLLSGESVGDAYTLAEQVAFAVLDTDNRDRAEAANFWERIAGDREPDVEAVRGFVEGAIKYVDEQQD